MDGRTSNSIHFWPSIPKTVEETEIDEYGRDQDNGPGYCDGRVPGMEGVRQLDHHFR